MTQFFLSMHRVKKLSHFDLKGWVSGGIIIRPGKVSNWRIFESIAWTLNIESIWLSMLCHLDSQCWANLTLNVEPIRLSMLNQFDSQCWVNLTLNVESIRLSMLSQFDSNILQLPTLRGRILVPQVTQLCMSNDYIFSLCVSKNKIHRHNYSELDDSTPQSINQDFGFSI